MRILLHSRAVYILGAALLIVIAIGLLLRVLGSKDEAVITATVSRGNIIEFVAVSGVVESESTANLTFPVSDTIEHVNVVVGDEVKVGEILATLVQADLKADRQDAIATLEIATADRDELLAGPRNEARDITSSEVENATANLARVKLEQEEKVENARRILLSSSLVAKPTRASNDDTPPTVTGSYTCENEGTYSLDVYPSGSKSGYSYRLSGLETGTYTAITESASSLGTCGLSIQFAGGEAYGNSDWYITIPNKESATYTTNLNAYDLALVTKDNAIETAEEALDTALKEATLENASPRDEELRRANAEVLRANAGLDRINAQIENRTLRAPFDGLITDVNITIGEIVGTEPVITLVGNNTFDLSARIPEIDIAKLAVNQKAEVAFDARANESVDAEISFISPLATEIDGVAYFKAKLVFPEPPSWLREGLNADVDIIVKKRENVLRLSKRFVVTEGEETFVFRKVGEEMQKVIIETGFSGNDGFVEIIGLSEGDTVVSP